jgi:hypothetical protein
LKIEFFTGTLQIHDDHMQKVDTLFQKISSENIQKSPSLNQMVEALVHLKQQLEYSERQDRSGFIVVSNYGQ